MAAVALIDDHGRVLLARRPEGKSFEGMYEFPGGKVEPYETPEAALVRELKEELDIDVVAADLEPLTFASHSYDRFHLLMPVWSLRRWGGQAVGNEGQALVWADEQELREGKYPMPPADIPLIDPIAAAMRPRVPSPSNAAT